MPRPLKPVRILRRAPLGAVSRDELAKRFYPQSEPREGKRQVLVRGKTLGIEHFLVISEECARPVAYYFREDVDRMEVEIRMYRWRCEDIREEREARGIGRKLKKPE